MYQHDYLAARGPGARHTAQPPACNWGSAAAPVAPRSAPLGPTLRSARCAHETCTVRAPRRCCCAAPIQAPTAVAQASWTSSATPPPHAWPAAAAAAWRAVAGGPGPPPTGAGGCGPPAVRGVRCERVCAGGKTLDTSISPWCVLRGGAGGSRPGAWHRPSSADVHSSCPELHACGCTSNRARAGADEQGQHTPNS